MRRSIVITAAIIWLISAKTFAQNDSTRYINGLPVSEDDTARQFLDKTDLEPKNSLGPVSISQLPQKLRDALEKGDQYDGWKDSTIYFEKNTGLYHVPVKYSEGVKIFGLNENGDPVTFREVSTRQEQ